MKSILKKLNENWGPQILSWDALLANEVKPDKACLEWVAASRGIRKGLNGIRSKN